MQWLIALVVISLLLAPVMWMMPSKQQQRQGRLRMAARSAGLQVQLAPLPQSRRQQVRKEDTVMGVCYTLLIPRTKGWQRGQWFAWRRAPEEEARFAGEPGTALQAQLESWFGTVSADVVAIESDQRGLSLYWRERGSEEDVQVMAEATRRLAAWMEEHHA